MEHRDKIRVALTVASLTLLTLLFTTHYRRRRNQKKKCPPSSCYLHSELKPQLFFKHVLADNSFSQFKHFNPHPKEKENGSNVHPYGAEIDTLTAKENGSNVHPYEAEIDTLTANPKIVFRMDEIIKKDMEMKSSYVWVETESQLKELANTLRKEKVFAVDTEQHSLRSFLGLTALIQISTGKEDYLVDTIALHDVMGVLRAVFADPGICKVFHGADNDVLWLQRDFHIYVVNLFDTAKACDVLSKPQKSLAYLLETYCGVTTNKLLQREDWRQRPLSAEMLRYAQTDAHYLLHIASCLIAELKQKDNGNSLCSEEKFYFVLEASRRSNMICKQLYTKEIEDCPGESAASSILYRHFNNHGGSSVSCETQDLVRRLCMWREFMGRVHDESLRYVLSDQAIVSLAEKVPASPVELFDIIAQADLNGDPVNFSSSLSSPSPVVCSHLDDLFYLIEDKNSSLDDIFPMLLQKCLGENATCPLSVYNYTLLINYDLQLTNRFVPKQNGTKKSKQVAKKSSRELFVQKFSCKSQVYHNCRIYANDGRLLCYCDRRKLEWYLQRELAKLVEDDPPAIMLLFEPKGRPEDEGNDFYIRSKKNICVGCGEGSHYLRYRIIPSCYRMHFPEHLKSHRSHDIVLLCVDCHEVSHAAAEKYKKKIAAEFGIPLFVRKVFDSGEAPSTSDPSPSEMNVEEAGVSPLQLRTAAMALLRHGSRMPLNRQEELIQIVRQYYGGRDISEQDLENALLVGMSPHERRRLHKKREKALQKSSGSFLSDKEQMNDHDSIVKATTENILDFDTRHVAEATKAEQTGKIVQNCFIRADNGITEPCLDLSADDEVATAGSLENVNAEENEISGVEDTPAEDGQDNEKCPPKGATNLHPSSQDKSAPPRRNSKLSLLGHGPHGKQVVDYILSEYGEEGVREFCQRWRQVFVEALNPRFLPAGWDIKHSGRREFGEFSVYNPANKTSTADLS